MSELTDDLREIRFKVQQIKNTFKNTGTIEAEDLDFLCERTVRHTIMTHLAEDDWIRLRTLEVTSTLEIQDLVGQLEAK